MGRPAKFTEEDILDTAADVVASGGPAEATVSTIAERMGAPSGSIYHRFPSRDLLLGRLWIRTIKRSQTGFVERLTAPGPGCGVAAALHLPEWTRNNLTDAQVLLLYRREDLAARWPDELGPDLATLNDGITERLRDYARWRFGRASRANLERVTFALVDVPYGAVRRHIGRGRPPPPSIDDLVTSTVRHLLGDDA